MLITRKPLTHHDAPVHGSLRSLLLHLYPKVTKAIPVDRLFTLINEAADIPSMRVVVFTGGECFLLKDNLNQLIAHATERGFSTRCVTNGYWATSRDQATRRVSELCKAGLKEINFSTGTFHARYVPIERVVYGAYACLTAGINHVD